MTIDFTTKQSCVFFFSYGWRHCNLWTQPDINRPHYSCKNFFHWFLFTQIIFDSFYFIFVRNKSIFTKNKLLSDSKGIHHFLKPLLAPCKVWEERKVAIVFTRNVCATCVKHNNRQQWSHSAHQRQLLNCQSMDVCQSSGNGITFLLHSTHAVLLRKFSEIGKGVTFWKLGEQQCRVLLVLGKSEFVCFFFWWRTGFEKGKQREVHKLKIISGCVNAENFRFWPTSQYGF